jgi:ClpP class serine protease
MRKSDHASMRSIVQELAEDMHVMPMSQEEVEQINDALNKEAAIQPLDLKVISPGGRSYPSSALLSPVPEEEKKEKFVPKWL